MKTVLKLVLWVLSIVFAYMIYLSVNAPIEFKKVKQERFTAVINVMKDIRNAQEAHKTVKGEYAADFNALIQFVDSSQYIITQQRDSSFTSLTKCIELTCLKRLKSLILLGLFL
jgi:type II secretory pathway pseudopilin PulG